MAFDADLTPLGGTGVVTEREEAVLAAVGIGSVEELVSAITDNPTGVARVLGASGEHVEEIVARAQPCISPAMQQALAAAHTRYATGALPPTRR